MLSLVSFESSGTETSLDCIKEQRKLNCSANVTEKGETLLDQIPELHAQLRRILFSGTDKTKGMWKKAGESSVKSPGRIKPL
jgi:hypothetical protein